MHKSPFYESLLRIYLRSRVTHRHWRRKAKERYEKRKTWLSLQRVQFRNWGSREGGKEMHTKQLRSPTRYGTCGSLNGDTISLGLSFFIRKIRRLE